MNINTECEIVIKGVKLDNVQEFCYLESMLGSNTLIHQEVNVRI